MSDLSKVDLYCREAQSIIVRSEEIIRCMKRDGAFEGQLLMADRGLIALKHLSRIIELSRKRILLETPSAGANAPAPAKQRWWSAIWRRARVADSALEART